jgi:hypothetical protein
VRDYLEEVKPSKKPKTFIGCQGRGKGFVARGRAGVNPAPRVVASFEVILLVAVDECGIIPPTRSTIQ